MKKIFVAMLLALMTLGILSGCNVHDFPLPAPSEENLPPDEDNMAEPPAEDDLSPIPDNNQQKYEVVLYFPDSDLIATYRVKTEIFAQAEDLPKAALEAWLAGPEHKELTGLINADANVVIEYVEDVEGIAHVSFSQEIQDVNLGSGGELMFAEQIAMIMQQFGFEQTQLLLEGEVVDTLLGHLYTKEPITAKDPDEYLWVEEKDTREFVLQNVAFRIYEPAPGTEVKDKLVVRGLARVFEAAFQYEFEDGHNILDKGCVMASKGAPEWGEFEIVIDVDGVTGYYGTIILYEVSAKDGSRLHELQIPVTIAK
ncbi:MAG: hypothetical protein GX197_10390 [Firmicutes bacterium]|nr:hypothetical protein [Bacillota bacterium]